MNGDGRGAAGGDGRGTAGGGPGALDRPGPPSRAAAWDARSGEWLPEPEEGDPGDSSPFGSGRPGPAAAAMAATGAADGREGQDTAGRHRSSPRRSAGDPVKALLHRHRALCERAVDPLEIAAGLEAHGVTDRTAAGFRHRDVFSLAEELYARVPRDDEHRPHPEPAPTPRVRADWALLACLPGTFAALTVTGVRLTQGRPRLLLAAAGVLAVALALRLTLRRGPLAAPSRALARHTATGTRAWTCWLLGYALLGDGLLRAALDGGPHGLPTGTAHGPWPVATVPVLALALATAPAAWSTHLLTTGARRRLAGSRGLEEFTAAVQPLLLGTFALCLGALTGLLALCGTVLGEAAGYPQALTLGALLLLARLLAVHHAPRGVGLALAGAAVTEAAAVALVLAGRLPGCAFLATPVDALANVAGPGGVPALACGAAALALLFRAARTLTRASAHAPTGDPE
ncbi:hypothetical protein [Streptomyces arenae]|uniref:hypothetical protein n=1 Tax=Streptomyces arenae TaxID=29301 RepID=UPI00265B4933|nr:hypothetical protein [Streptomyces arenae]MCG7204595.1 hypothetical protein [Streptomyces arenae]